MVEFDADDLSRFYIDVLKDRMYSSATDAVERRSAQTALWTIFRGLAALLAPILSFTAEEAWQHAPEVLRGDALSVFDLPMPSGRDLVDKDAAALERWTLLKSLRAIVAAHEGERDFQLQAFVRVSPADYEWLVALGDGLREALVVSSLRLERDEATEAPIVELRAAEGEKCARCWKYLPLGAEIAHPSLCAPCAAVVALVTASA